MKSKQERRKKGYPFWKKAKGEYEQKDRAQGMKHNVKKVPANRLIPSNSVAENICGKKKRPIHPTIVKTGKHVRIKENPAKVRYLADVRVLIDRMKIIIGEGVIYRIDIKESRNDKNE